MMVRASRGRPGGSVPCATSLRPSARSISPSSKSAFNTATTSAGALSASSTTRTRPCTAARTRAESSQARLPPSTRGADVSVAKEASRCSCTYSRSARKSSSALSQITFLPTPWFPMRSTLRRAATSRSTAATRRTCDGMETKLGTLGTRSCRVGARRAISMARPRPGAESRARRSVVGVTTIIPEAASPSAHRPSALLRRCIAGGGPATRSRMAECASSQAPSSQAPSTKITSSRSSFDASSSTLRAWATAASKCFRAARGSSRRRAPTARSSAASALPHSSSKTLSLLRARADPTSTERSASAAKLAGPGPRRSDSPRRSSTRASAHWRLRASSRSAALSCESRSRRRSSHRSSGKTWKWKLCARRSRHSRRRLCEKRPSPSPSRGMKPSSQVHSATTRKAASTGRASAHEAASNRARDVRREPSGSVAVRSQRSWPSAATSTPGWRRSMPSRTTRPPLTAAATMLESRQTVSP
mmetsp:Transcript_11457/g.38250  ORF Transcript_11457/g.38250 Transcript_11457/m.38250 type:complete len:476 (-) Transcript_11457:128-1555(-)